MSIDGAGIDTLTLRSFHDNDAGAPTVVFFPHAGGSASYFFPLSKALAPHVRSYAVQYPGRQDRRREPLVDSVCGLADSVLASVSALVDEVSPVMLMGHSLGASVAYEVMRALESRPGPAPARLIASSRSAPNDSRSFGIHALPDRQLIDEVGFLAGTASAIMDDPEIMAAFLPAIRNDYKAAETYRWEPAPPLRAPISVFTGRTDPRVSERDVQGWAEFTATDCSVQVFAGGHFYLTDEPDTVAAAIIALAPNTPELGRRNDATT